MDNCGREKQKEYVLALYLLPVELGIFQKVKVGVLMVGHMHGDVDQLFSCFSIYQSKCSPPTLPALMFSLEQAYTPSPTAIEVDRIYDVALWLNQHIEKVAHHSQPHILKVLEKH